jgi:translocation and assembly module TamA
VFNGLGGTMRWRMQMIGAAFAVALSSAAALAQVSDFANDEAEAEAILNAEPAPSETGRVPGTTEDALRYSLLLVGFDELALTPAFKDVSLLRAGRRKPVDSYTRLMRRIRDDRDTALRLLHSEGWYGASVDSGVSPPIGGRVRVSLAVTANARYLFGEPGLVGVAPEVADALRAGPLASQQVRQDDPARSSAVVLGEQAMSQWLLENGYPFSALGDRSVVVDHATQRMTPTWQLSPGPLATTGALRFPDEKPRLQRHLARLARFKPGERYDQRQIEDLRSAMISTGLFSSVQATAEPSADNPAVADIVFDTEPAKRRTIAVSGGYGTGEGPKLETSWQHRSIFGGEERLTLLGRLGTEEQSGRADLIVGLEPWQLDV